MPNHVSLESNSTVSALVRESFKSWLTVLKSTVESYCYESKEVFIIAISRKMPRVFKWIQSPHSRLSLGLTEDEHKEYADFIDKCRITTEYALPFLFTKDRDKDSYEIIVVDDIIIRGTTLRQVSCDVAAMTGKRSIASAIFKCEGIGFFEYADTSKIDGMVPLTPDQRKEAVDFIAKCIMTSSLPVDLVYPILNQSRPFEYLSRKLERNASIVEWKHYDVKADLVDDGQASEEMNEGSINRHTQIQGEIRSLSVLVNGEVRKFCNNDFSKIRLFDKENGKCTLAVYSPNIISTDVLKDGTPFYDEKYKEVWCLVRGKSRDDSCSYADLPDFIDLAIAKRRIENRCMLSYAAWTNFLLSISMFNRIDKETSLFTGIELDKTLCLEDIALLLGHELAAEILPKVNELLKDGLVASYLIETISVNDILAPEELRGKYEEDRKKLVYGQTRLRNTLDSLFKLQQIHLPENDLESRGLGETINSLHNCIALYFQDGVNDMEIEINRYIDKAIDCGEISAFYAEIPNVAGDVFVKRFFRFGSNSVL